MTKSVLTGVKKCVLISLPLQNSNVQRPLIADRVNSALVPAQDPQGPPLVDNKSASLLGGSLPDVSEAEKLGTCAVILTVKIPFHLSNAKNICLVDSSALMSCGQENHPGCFALWCWYTYLCSYCLCSSTFSITLFNLREDLISHEMHLRSWGRNYFFKWIPILKFCTSMLLAHFRISIKQFHRTYCPQKSIFYFYFVLLYFIFLFLLSNDVAMLGAV